MGVEDSRARGPGTRGDGGAPEDTAVRPGMGRYLLASGALLMLALVAVHQQWTWRFDQVLFDAHLALWARPPSPDIVIVAIDEESVTAIGRWPWSRRVHAAIVEQLTQAGARAIALDLIFAEPDRADPGADAALAAALARSARTVLPLVPEERHLGGPLVETRPIPELAAAAPAFDAFRVPPSRPPRVRGDPRRPGRLLQSVRPVAARPVRTGRLQQRGRHPLGRRQLRDHG